VIAIIPSYRNYNDLHKKFYGLDKFSDTDINFLKSQGLPFYLVGPDGKLWEYDPVRDAARLINDNMPKDPNLPDNIRYPGQTSGFQNSANNSQKIPGGSQQKPAKDN